MRLGLLPISVASGQPAAIASASQAATSNPAIAMRTMPCTPMSAKRSASLLQRSAGARGAPLNTRPPPPRELGDPRAPAQKKHPKKERAECAAPGPEATSRSRGVGSTPRPQGISHRDLDPDRANGANGQERRLHGESLNSRGGDRKVPQA